MTVKVRDLRTGMRVVIPPYGEVVIDGDAAWSSVSGWVFAWKKRGLGYATVATADPDEEFEVAA
jgi:hypothetical protein